MASKAKVYFFFDNVDMTLRNRTKLKNLVECLFKKEGIMLLRLNYIFCSDKTLLEINRRYLRHNYYTDIVTFDLSENPDQIIGEIYISVDRVKENAENIKVSFKNELFRVIIHGALHLCGFNDKSARQKLQMRKKEDYYLALIG